uniref:Endoplasmic reticulum oxidoreductin-1 n=1 Tax=Plectus sambesii TaxID=2011161 RepID=A0A914VM73_9BILA
MTRRVGWLAFSALAAVTLAAMVGAQLPPGKSCFCKLAEAVDECACAVDSVDGFNNNKMFPVLQALLQKDFFRYYKVNMERPCPFWPDDRECGSKECGIEHCDDEVPEGLRKPPARPNGSQHAAKEPCEDSNNFDPLDMTISSAKKEKLQDMDLHDENEDKFCDVDDEHSASMHYVDLARNPERYTGYKGNSAQKVWQSIYQENCFKPDMKFDKNFLLHPTTTGLCLEKRVFFRLISALHTAITISIAAHNYKPAPHGFGEGTWYRNVDMFKARFSPETTWGEGPQRLKNLYFVYLLELRALVKAAPYLQNEMFYTGDDVEDSETRQAVERIIDIANSFKDHFDETMMFTGIESHARELREEFRQHFMNISRIMDCVGCDKCRLWGKLQTHGMGTALKILFSDIPSSHYRTPNGVVQLPFQLTRNEVVALFQSLGRYASSIREVAEFRRILDV